MSGMAYEYLPPFTPVFYARGPGLYKGRKSFLKRKSYHTHQDIARVEQNETWGLFNSPDYILSMLADILTKKGRLVEITIDPKRNITRATSNLIIILYTPAAG